jgi:uncharacterized membrane protein
VTTDLDRTDVDDEHRRYAPERLLFLVDGVFAISMTLLALDVRIPDEVPDTVAGFADSAPHLFVRLGVFVAAFLITGRFWLIHHKQMAGLHHVDSGVAQRTILFLAGITSLPVATGVLFRYGAVPGAVAFGAVVLAVTTALSARLWWHVSDPARGLADVDPDVRRETGLRMVLVVVIYLLAVPIAYLVPRDLVAATPAVWLLLAGIDRVSALLYRLLRRRLP